VTVETELRMAPAPYIIFFPDSCDCNHLNLMLYLMSLVPSISVPNLLWYHGQVQLSISDPLYLSVNSVSKPQLERLFSATSFGNWRITSNPVPQKGLYNLTRVLAQMRINIYGLVAAAYVSVAEWLKLMGIQKTIPSCQ